MANYITPIPDYGDVMPLREFLESVRDGMFIDYDGFGYPVKDDKMDDDIRIYPSNVVHVWPKDATHIVWFNR